MCRMDDSPIARMRERARQMRRIAEMAHNPEIIEIVLKMAAEAEADAAELEASQPQMIVSIPPAAG